MNVFIALALLEMFGGAPHNIDLTKITKIESNDNRNAIGAIGERGLFQFRKKTWNWLVRMMKKQWVFETDAHDPVRSRRVANYYFAYLAKYVDKKLKEGKIYGERVSLIIACWNAGQGRVLKYKGVPPYKITRDYIKKYKKL